MAASPEMGTKTNGEGNDPADNSYSPLSVLQYLKDASADTKKEYLLAAQRQLHDRVADLTSKLRNAEFQLTDCEKALHSFNQNP